MNDNDKLESSFLKQQSLRRKILHGRLLFAEVHPILVRSLIRFQFYTMGNDLYSVDEAANPFNAPSGAGVEGEC